MESPARSPSDSFLRAALTALADAGDPTGARAALAAPAQIARRPADRKKRVAWAASQIVAHAHDPARAYRALCELLGALFEPLALAVTGPLPAPEVALTLPPAELLDAICPAPRILASELARAAKLDARALLADPERARRVLGVRSIALAAMAKHASELAAAAATDDAAVRAEVLRSARDASPQTRIAIAIALRGYLSHALATVRVAALDALRALRAQLDDDLLVTLLGDPAPEVRAGAASAIGRGPYPAAVDGALLAALRDLDAGVRAAALGAIARNTPMHKPSLVEPLRLVVQRHDQDTRTALYLLGKLAASDERSPQIAMTLRECVLGPRSDVAYVAAIVLGELGFDVPAMPLEDRLARAHRELAAPDRETGWSGVQEAKRLGAPAAVLVPALRTLGDRLVRDETPEARTSLAQLRELLRSLGVADQDLPRPPSRLDAWRGSTPTVRATHGAYAIGSIVDPVVALGLWDHGTGKRLLVVEGAVLLELVPGRAEVATVRLAASRNAFAWFFERFSVPSGERLGSLVIPESLTHGSPASLAIAGGLATVWCGHADAPYRFHIKLGTPDRLLDEVPTLGRRPATH